MTVVKWVFTDLSDMSSYTFEINPNDGGSPDFEKTITEENTLAPDGLTLMFEGADKTQSLSFSGVILHQAQYDAFVTWYRKRKQVQVTDDLGRTFVIYIKKFAPKRKRARSHPWKHEYTIDATILSWT